jgi:phosphoserine phosphatase RsbU/P
MKILIADDDRVTRRMLEVAALQWGYNTVLAEDGKAAWKILQDPEPPRLALLDWIMPGLSGLDICRRVRTEFRETPPYLILLTVKGNRSDIVEGLQGGADDYIAKPFDPEELRARLQVGVRIVTLQQTLAQQLADLRAAQAQVNQLEGLVPICCYCKRVRDDQNYWQQVESYVSAHSHARFSHGICPTCFETEVQPELERHRTTVQPVG